MQQSTFVKQICLLLTLLSAQIAFTQSYDLAVGVRLGTDLGVSLKMRVPPIDKNFTGEFIIEQDLDGEEVLMTLLAAQHIPLITRRLNLYAGMGVHKGWIESDPKYEVTVKEPFGLSFVGGAELNFKRWSISADYKPVVNLVGGNRVFNSSSAVTIRYIPFQRYDMFASPREKRKRQRQKKRKQKAKGKSLKKKK